MPPKKLKLTPSERKELKAKKKAERKLLAEQKKRQQKFDQLDRELKYGALTVQRHERNWKRMLLDIAVPEVRKELEYAWHNFERIVDAKDFTISLLMDEVRDSEEQYMMNIRSHCENIDRLVKLFNEQLNEIKIDNDNAIQQLKVQNEQEVSKIMSVHKDTEEFLNMMLYGLEMTLKEQEQFIRCEYCSRIDEEIGKNSEILQKLRYTIQEIYADLWNDTHHFLANYHKKTHERKKQYEFLNNQDEQVNTLLRNQLEKIRRMTNMIKKLKEKFVYLQSTQGQKVTDFLLERQFFADSFWALKTQLENEISTDNKNLTLLTVETNESVKYLDRLRKKGEQILTLAAICRKLESLKEKVLPFPLLGKASYNAPLEIDVDFFDDIQDLKLFWKKIGAADGIRFSMYEEKNFLIQENKRLREQLHTYCECLNCPAYDTMTAVSTSGFVNKTDANVEMNKYSKIFTKSFSASRTDVNNEGSITLEL